MRYWLANGTVFTAVSKKGVKKDILVEDGKIVSCKFNGGCAGNTQGVASLVTGMDVEDAIKRLKGIRCGFKTTSCPDQLALALEESLN